MKSKYGRCTTLALWILCIFVVSHPCHAQSRYSMGEILKGTESHYQNLQAFTADFLQLTTSSATNTITTEASGILYYQKPRQMRWEYKTPEPQVFIANHGLAWLHEPSERQISLFDAATFFNSPLAQTFFDGVSSLKTHFDVSLDPAHSTPTVAVLKLVPQKEDPNIRQLRLWIDLKGYEISKVETEDALANTNLIVLKSQKAITGMKTSLFELNVPPSTNVVDADGRVLSQAEINNLKRKVAASK
jgi:outer membrane lipoprotein carrier protein